MSITEQAGKPAEKQSEKLRMWQDRLADSDMHYKDPLEAKMDERERLYRGKREIAPLVDGDWGEDGRPMRAGHVRNIVFENIETQVSASIPTPKVTPRRKEDEGLAETVERFLRNELDRLPFETLNDMAERTVPIQGGCAFWLDWDQTAGGGERQGEIQITLLHPKQLAPQPGVFTSIEDMDWLIVKQPTTREAVRRKYGIAVDAGEAEPELRGEGAEETGDAVTLYTGYARNDRGGIDRYVWANDTQLEDLEDYQARRRRVCAACGGPWPEEGDACPVCGGRQSRTETADTEQVFVPIRTAWGLIPGQTPGPDGTGAAALVPTEIPYYRPDTYPVILQRSVSVYGQLLGNSDVDIIADQQNTTNRLEQKIIDRIMKAGSRITLPDRADIRLDPKDGEKIYVNAADKALIDVYTFSGDLRYEMTYLSQVYEESRQMLGITDSFQGRKDSTATSGTAKQFAAAQSAGRLESKRIMKQAAYAEIFQRMFRLALAYCDEPRQVSYKDVQGRTEYQTFSRYDFLERDGAGRWRWNDRFLFSCDTSAPLASNREALWQETRMNLQTGAFGDPASTETLILFWGKMEELHYPGAGTTKKYLEEQLARAQAQAGMQAMLAAGRAGAPAVTETPTAGMGENPALPTAGMGENPAARAAGGTAADRQRRGVIL